MVLLDRVLKVCTVINLNGKEVYRSDTFENYLDAKDDNNGLGITIPTQYLEEAVKLLETYWDMSFDGIMKFLEDNGVEIEPRLYQHVQIAVLFKHPDLEEEFCYKSLECNWTAIKKIDYEFETGQKTNYDMIDFPVKFVTETFAPLELKDKEFDHLTGWLIRDLNDLDGNSFNYMAEIKFYTDGGMNWGFNGLNAMLMFREMANEYVTINSKGEQYLQINFHPNIGYWFGKLELETIKYYFDIVGA